MKLVKFQGLNCRQVAMASVAANLGINFLDAFCSLWSETDFFFDHQYDIFSSTRLPENYRQIGLETNPLLYGARDEFEYFLELKSGEFFVIGMDVYHIPWHSLFGYFHDPHFFFARKEGDYFVCYDAFYLSDSATIKADKMLSSAIEVSHVFAKDVGQSANETVQFAKDIGQKNNLQKNNLLVENGVSFKDSILPYAVCLEAKNAQKVLPNLKNYLLSEIRECSVDRSRNRILIKKIAALISNRHLFGKYIASVLPKTANCDNPFNRHFFSKWEGVKNGLYKAQIQKNCEKTISDICSLVSELLDKESEFAKTLLLKCNYNYAQDVKLTDLPLFS